MSRVLIGLSPDYDLGNTLDSLWYRVCARWVFEYASILVDFILQGFSLLRIVLINDSQVSHHVEHELLPCESFLDDDDLAITVDVTLLQKSQSACNS
jgi:hypothetical protein